MAASEIPNLPQTPSSANFPSQPESVPEVSLERLDSLLEAYLELLDEYTTLRTQLSKQFSEGFFALARANHTSNNLGSGRRYGEEDYDERMKAQRRITYSVENSMTGRGGNSTEVKDTDGLDEAEKVDNGAAMPGSKISIQKTKDVVSPEKGCTGDLEKAKNVETPRWPSAEDSPTETA